MAATKAAKDDEVAAKAAEGDEMAAAKATEGDELTAANAAEDDEVAAVEAAKDDEVAAAKAVEAAKGDKRATDLFEHMLSFADEQLAFDCSWLLRILAEFGEGCGENKGGPNCMRFNSAKAAATAAAAAEQATTKRAAAAMAKRAAPAKAGAGLALLAGATLLAPEGGQGGGQVVICPQVAQLSTVWIAAVSVAIFLLHAENQGEQKMRDCAKELDCIANQNPRLLSFAVVCPTLKDT